MQHAQPHRGAVRIPRLLIAAKWPAHIWLLALYPILYLYAVNIMLVNISETVPVILVSFVVTTLVFLALRILLKDDATAGAITTILVLTFLSYGHIFNLSFQWSVQNRRGVVHIHRCLLLLVFSATLVSVFVVLKRRSFAQIIASYFNLVAIVLIVFPLYSIGRFLILSSKDYPTLELVIPPPARAPDPATLPDIYYVILDSYPRADELAELYGFDNSEFLEALKERGFYVADESLSNYNMTLPSMASSLNMQYMDAFADVRVGKEGLKYLQYSLRYPSVGRAFQDRGYTFYQVHLGREQIDSDILADIIVDFTSSGIVYYERGNDSSQASDNKYVPLFLQTTLLKAVPVPLTFETPSFKTWFSIALNQNKSLGLHHPSRTLLSFEVLRQISGREGPAFIYMHILKPHQPCIFDQHGFVVKELAYYDDQAIWTCDPESFINQLIYINKLVLDTIDKILANSPVPPIIIFQGDHSFSGGSLRLRTNRILNVYYLPAGGADQLYPSISPVNTFRLILDYYFDTDLGLLEDKSYLLPKGYEEPLLFIESETGVPD